MGNRCFGADAEGDCCGGDVSRSVKEGDARTPGAGATVECDHGRVTDFERSFEVPIRVAKRDWVKLLNAGGRLTWLLAEFGSDHRYGHSESCGVDVVEVGSR